MSFRPVCWDYAVGAFLVSLVYAYTMGSSGHAHRSFFVNVHVADASNISWALLPGVIFNFAPAASRRNGRGGTGCFGRDRDGCGRFLLATLRSIRVTRSVVGGHVLRRRGLNLRRQDTER
jgi:hypothetical protein